MGRGREIPGARRADHSRRGPGRPGSQRFAEDVGRSLGPHQAGLDRKVMTMFFPDPSRGTRPSFESAMYLHGGLAITIEPGAGSWSWELDPHAVMDGTNVENIVEAAGVLGRYADVVGIRA